MSRLMGKLYSNLQKIPFIPEMREKIETVRGKENPVLPDNLVKNKVCPNL